MHSLIIWTIVKPNVGTVHSLRTIYHLKWNNEHVSDKAREGGAVKMMNELSHDQMKIKKVHSLDPNDLPAFIKSGNMDTMFGFCSIRMMYEEASDLKDLEGKFRMSLEKNSHLFNQENMIELMMRGEDVRRKLLNLRDEQIPNKGVQELLNLIHDIHQIEVQKHEKDIFKTHISKQAKLLKIKKLSYDFNQSEFTIEIDPVIQYTDSELYDKLMDVILTHQYVVEHYPQIESVDANVLHNMNLLAAK